MSSTAPSSPALRVGVTEVRRRPGNRIDVRRSVELGGLAVSVAAVPAGAEAVVEVVLESLSDGVTVHGSVEVPWEGACRRCLEPTSGTVRAPIDEVFKDHPDDGDTLPFDGDAVDLGPVVHDAVSLALPLAPLCRPDCPGPAPDEFPVGSGAGGEDAVDPRWAALSELRFDSDPED